MKIEVDEGCYGRRVFVDKTDWHELPVIEQNYILCSIFNKLFSERDQFSLTFDLLSLLEPDDSEFDNDPCEQCGSYFQSDTYEV